MAKKKAGRKPAAKKSAGKAAKAAKKSGPKRTRDGGPVGWPTLSPYMTVRDGQASIEFYARAFGFKVMGEVMRGDDGSVQHASMVLGAAAIMFGPAEGSMGLKPPVAGTPDSLSLYVYVPDVDAVHARAQRGGAAVVQPPADQFWRDRTAAYKDPDGYHWTFATHLGGPIQPP